MKRGKTPHLNAQNGEANLLLKTGKTDHYLVPAIARAFSVYLLVSEYLSLSHSGRDTLGKLLGAS